MAAVSDTRSVDIEDDIKWRRPPIHPPRPQAHGEGDRAARRWRSPRVSGATRLVEDPTCRWRSLCAGGAGSSVEEPTRRWSRAPVEEPTRRWSHATGGGSHSSMEEPMRWWSPFTSGGAHTSAAGGHRWRWCGTLAHRLPIYNLDRD
jgi:hypothetical protein